MSAWPRRSPAATTICRARLWTMAHGTGPLPEEGTAATTQGFSPWDTGLAIAIRHLRSEFISTRK